MTFSSQTFVLAVSGASRTRTVGALGTLSCLTFDRSSTGAPVSHSQSSAHQASPLSPKVLQFLFYFTLCSACARVLADFVQGDQALEGTPWTPTSADLSVFSQLCARLMEQPKVTECSVHSGKPSEDYLSSCKPLDDSSTARETALNAQLGKYHLTA